MERPRKLLLLAGMYDVLMFSIFFAACFEEGRDLRSTFSFLLELTVLLLSPHPLD